MENPGYISNTFLDHAQTAAISAPKILEQYLLQTGRAVLGIFTVPAFLILRRNFGSTAIHPITYVLSWLVFQIASLMSFVIEGPGLVNIWALYLAFVVLSILHAWRLRAPIIDMDLEDDSEDEGTPWRVFKLLPFHTQPIVRCIYEPLALLLGSWVLQKVGVFTTSAGIFFAVVSLALFLRTSLRYYEVWVYMRDLRNVGHRAQQMQLAVSGRLSAEQFKNLVFIAGPVLPQPRKSGHSLTDDVPAPPAKAPTIDPEFENLKTPTLTPVAPPAA